MTMTDINIKRLVPWGIGFLLVVVFIFFLNQWVDRDIDDSRSPSVSSRTSGAKIKTPPPGRSAVPGTAPEALGQNVQQQTAAGREGRNSPAADREEVFYEPPMNNVILIQ